MWRISLPEAKTATFTQREQRISTFSWHAGLGVIFGTFSFRDVYFIGKVDGLTAKLVTVFSGMESTQNFNSCSGSVKFLISLPDRPELHFCFQFSSHNN